MTNIIFGLVYSLLTTNFIGAQLEFLPAVTNAHQYRIIETYSVTVTNWVNVKWDDGEEVQVQVGDPVDFPNVRITNYVTLASFSTRTNQGLQILTGRKLRR